MFPCPIASSVRWPGSVWTLPDTSGPAVLFSSTIPESSHVLNFSLNNHSLFLVTLILGPSYHGGPSKELCKVLSANHYTATWWQRGAVFPNTTPEVVSGASWASALGGTPTSAASLLVALTKPSAGSFFLSDSVVQAT